MSESLLQIRNHHTGACSDPPIINNDNPNVYIGYFENPFGEQWIYAYDRKHRTATLRGGDIGWNTLIAVHDGEAEGINLGAAEKLWLQACWKATGGA